MDTDDLYDDLCVRYSLLWINGLTESFRDAWSRFSRTCSGFLPRMPRPLFHWWLGWVPVPTFQVLSLISSMVRLSLLPPVVIYYMLVFYNAVNTYTRYMLFGANTFTFTNHFMGDFLSFWVLESSLLRAFVKWIYAGVSQFDPDTSYADMFLPRMFPFYRWPGIYLILEGCGATCASVSLAGHSSVVCTFRDDTLLHNFAKQLAAAGYETSAASKIASAVYILLALGAAFATTTVYCFFIMNITRPYMFSTDELLLVIAGVWCGWNTVA